MRTGYYFGSKVIIVLAIFLVGCAMDGFLRPGGKTVGGPGLVKIKSGQSQGIFAISGPVKKSALCLTVFNIGENNIIITGIDEFDSEKEIAQVQPNQSKTACAFVNSLSLKCEVENESKNECDAIWRIDEK